MLMARSGHRPRCAAGQDTDSDTAQGDTDLTAGDAVVQVLVIAAREDLQIALGGAAQTGGGGVAPCTTSTGHVACAAQAELTEPSNRPANPP